LGSVLGVGSPKLQTEATRALCAINSDGVIVGLVTLHALAELTMIKSVRPDWRFERRALPK
jgi:hypothetical protein